MSKREHISFASYTRYKDVNFAGKYLSNSCLEGSEFVGVTFQSSNLSKSNFSNSRLTEVDFSYSDPVSYTHLDVYKRQSQDTPKR